MSPAWADKVNKRLSPRWRIRIYLIAMITSILTAWANQFFAAKLNSLVANNQFATVEHFLLVQVMVAKSRVCIAMGLCFAGNLLYLTGGRPDRLFGRNRSELYSAIAGKVESNQGKVVEALLIFGVVGYGSVEYIVCFSALQAKWPEFDLTVPTAAYIAIMVFIIACGWRKLKTEIGTAGKFVFEIDEFEKAVKESAKACTQEMSTAGAVLADQILEQSKESLEIAIMKLSIHLDNQLRELAAMHGVDCHVPSLSLLDDLASQGFVTREIVDSLDQFRKLRNKILLLGSTKDKLETLRFIEIGLRLLTVVMNRPTK